MDVEQKNTDELKPYDRNPRVNDPAVDAVAASIREFGFRQPIVLDGDDVIVVGHTRWKAAQKIGLPQVPVVRADDLTPEQIRAYRIADNQTNTIAKWDADLLAAELGALDDGGFDLSPIGFTEDEVEKMLAQVQPPEDFPTIDENIETDHECPKCGYRWS